MCIRDSGHPDRHAGSGDGYANANRNLSAGHSDADTYSNPNQCAR